MLKKLKVSCLALIFVMSGMVGLYLVGQNAKGFTQVSGNVSGTWDSGGSPYYVIGDLTVLSGSTLEIDASTGPVDVIFNGSYNIWVQGNFFVNGTGANRVTFTSNNITPAPGDWTSITALGLNGKIVMKNATVEYAVTGVVLETNDNVVEQTEVASCQNNGIFLNNADNNRLTNNYIHDLNVGIWLVTASENNTIENCTVENTGNNGIFLQTGSHNTTVRDITMNNIGANGIHVQDSDYFTAVNGTIYNGVTGIYLLNSDHGVITGMNISEQDNYGLAMNNANNVTADHMMYYRCGVGGIGAGIAVTSGSRDNYFANSSMKGSHFGIDIYLTSMWNTVYNCSLSGNNYGMRIMQTSHNNTIENSTFYDHPNYALDMNGAIDNRIIGNRFENATLRGIFFEAGSLRNKITENTIIDNRGYGIEILAGANNNTMYNNNFFNNSIHAYDADGYNFWNITYSQSPLMGGNYWDNYTGMDQMSGPLQNIAGSDLIGDTPYVWIDGNTGSKDNYPLTEPYGGVPPESRVNATAGWYISSATISANASDVGSGVSNIYLWYRFSTDGAAWGAWSNYGQNNTGSWSWNFGFPGVEGFYEFYSVAVDRAGYEEAAPAMADQSCGYDSTSPGSTVIPPDSYVQSMSPLVLEGTASDALSGVSLVRLWYRYSTDNSTWGAWTFFETDNSANWSWSFDFPNDDGFYQFYTEAIDLAGNYEAAPGTADASCLYDSSIPISSVDPILKYWFTSMTLTVNATASDQGGGLKNVELFYRFSDDNNTWGNWTSFGADAQPPWSWSFDFPSGQGWYEFHTIAEDITGNLETALSTADMGCGLDSVAPVTAATASGPYWRTSKPAILLSIDEVESVSGLSVSEVYYRYSTDNATWGNWTIFNGTIFYEGDGYYQYYSVAADVAGNIEATPSMPDAMLAYDSAPPSITDNSATNGTAGQTFTFSILAEDNLTIKEVRVVYSFDGGNETNATMTHQSSSYGLSTQIPDEASVLRYTLAASDEAGNIKIVGERTVEITQNAPAGKSSFPWWILVVIIIIVAAMLVFLFKGKGPERMVEKMDEEEQRWEEKKAAESDVDMM